MVWIIASLATAIIITLTNIVDSHILSKKMPSLLPYFVTMGITQVIVASAFTVFPFPASPGLPHILVAFGSGLFNGFGLIILLNCLQKGEVSRVIPVTASSPIFVALLSMPLLAEMLNFWEWLAVVLTVAGAVLISLQRDGGARKTRLQKSFFLLFLTALMFAISSIGFKYALETFSFWNMVSINGICVAVAALLFSVRKSTLSELKNLPQRTQRLGLVFGNQLLATAGMAVSFVAISKGPIALVSTIMNIRPAFVFIFSLIISRFYPNFINEPLNRRTILVKLIGIAMITGGVAIISLSN